MVNRSRGQSSEAPSRRNCRVIVPPDSAFHCQTRSRNASRPISRRPLPSAASSLSTTICVAIPAWSVPGCHSASRPCIRRQRTNVSCTVNVRACPICRLPVTFGGGIMTVNGVAFEPGSHAKLPAFSQPSYSRGSISPGENLLSSVITLSRGPAHAHVCPRHPLSEPALTAVVPLIREPLGRRPSQFRSGPGVRQPAVNSCPAIPSAAAAVPPAPCPPASAPRNRPGCHGRPVRVRTRLPTDNAAAAAASGATNSGVGAGKSKGSARGDNGGTSTSGGGTIAFGSASISTCGSSRAASGSASDSASMASGTGSTADTIID